MIAVVGGSAYPGENAIVFSDGYEITSSGFLYTPITFPGLIVTKLTPGEIVTIVLSLVYRIPLIKRAGRNKAPGF